MTLKVMSERSTRSRASSPTRRAPGSDAKPSVVHLRRSADKDRRRRENGDRRRVAQIGAVVRRAAYSDGRFQGERRQRGVEAAVRDLQGCGRHAVVAAAPPWFCTPRPLPPPNTLAFKSPALPIAAYDLRLTLSFSVTFCFLLSSQLCSVNSTSP